MQGGVEGSRQEPGRRVDDLLSRVGERLDRNIPTLRWDVVVLPSIVIVELPMTCAVVDVVDRAAGAAPEDGEPGELLHAAAMIGIARRARNGTVRSRRIMVRILLRGLRAGDGTGSRRRAALSPASRAWREVAAFSSSHRRYAAMVKKRKPTNTTPQKQAGTIAELSPLRARWLDGGTVGTGARAAGLTSWPTTKSRPVASTGGSDVTSVSRGPLVGEMGSTPPDATVPTAVTL